MLHRTKHFALGLAAMTASVLGFSTQQASAALVPGTTLYVTAVNGSATGLYAVKLNGTNNIQNSPGGFTVTPIDTGVGVDYDSLIFDNSGNVILTGDGGVTKITGFNPVTNTYVSKVTANIGGSFGSNSQLQDLTLEPMAVTNTIAGLTVGHQYALVSDMGDGTIGRVDITTGTPTFVGLLGGGTNYGTFNGAGGQPGPEGLVYVPDKNSATGYDLIATVGNRNNAGQRSLVQLNPSTGAAITSNEKTGLSYNDGLAYDTYSGKLFSSDRVDVSLYTNIDPLNLSSYVVSTVAFPSDGHGAPTQQPDGVAADGFGNIFDANYDSTGGPGDIMMYDETTGTMTIVAHVMGLDDISPLSGVGGPPTPEPASLGLMGLGAGALMLRRRRR